MEHASAVAAKTKASSLIKLFEDHSKISKLLQFEIFQLEKKVSHKIHCIFDNEAENKI